MSKGQQERGLGRYSGELANYRGAHQDPTAITQMLEDASERFNLVTPATSCAHVPEGFAVQMSAVVVAEDETYSPGGGKLALGKTALQRIAAAAGISWDPSRSGRLDDGKDPHYCHYRAVGAYRHFDGTTVVVQGEKIMDLRNGSAQAQAVKPGELQMQRKFILEHAETKARLRAIRSMGIRTAYPRDEIRKPFVVAKLAFTGQTQDPELRREFARMSAAAALGAGSALYGPQAPAQALPAPGDPELGSLPAPPVGTTAPDEDEGEAAPDLVPTGLPGAGKPLSELSREELEACMNKVQGWIESQKLSEEQAAKAQAFFDDALAEWERREIANPSEAAPW